MFLLLVGLRCSRSALVACFMFLLASLVISSEALPAFAADPHPSASGTAGAPGNPPPLPPFGIGLSDSALDPRGGLCRVVYNHRGDHVFRVIRFASPFASTEAKSNATSLRDDSFTQVVISGSVFPLLDVTDTTTSGGSYLAVLQSSYSSPNSSTNTPLEIASQAANTASVFASPPTLTSGYLGVDLIQLAGASGGNTYASPYWRMCAQGVVSSVNTALCWSARVLGGSASAGIPANTFEWTMSGLPSNSNFTMLWPSAVNLASKGQITVGPMPDNTQDDSGQVATFTGMGTGYSTSAAAGPITIEPGQLAASNTDSASKEGSLQILQSYKGSQTGTNTGVLACPDTTNNQTVVNCDSIHLPNTWVGVFNHNIPGEQGGTVTPVRYGRVPVQTNAGATFTNGQFICKDETHPGDVMDNMDTPCLLGESVGIAVGDASSGGTMHLVDLVPEASVSGEISQGLVLQFSCDGLVAASTHVYVHSAPCSNPNANTAEFTLPYKSGTYTFSNLYVNYTAAGVTGDQVVLFVNDTATSITCNPTSVGGCMDTSDTAFITAGQKYSLRIATHASDTLKNVDATIQLQ